MLLVMQPSSAGKIPPTIMINHGGKVPTVWKIMYGARAFAEVI